MQNRIAEFRNTRGITQDGLAKALGISRTYLSEVENGKRNMGGNLLLLTARIIGAKVEDIFFIDDVLHVERPTGTEGGE